MGLLPEVQQIDIDLTALCMWREARGEGATGMACVAWVILNRCLRRHTTPAVEVMRPWQFSSMTAKGDPQLDLHPGPDDTRFHLALTLAQSILTGEGGHSPIGPATMYYSTSIPFPKSWNPDVLEFVTQIGHHRFYTEL